MPDTTAADSSQLLGWLVSDFSVKIGAKVHTLFVLFNTTPRSPLFMLTNHQPSNWSPNVMTQEGFSLLTTQHGPNLVVWDLFDSVLKELFLSLVDSCCTRHISKLQHPESTGTRKRLQGTMATFSHTLHFNKTQIDSTLGAMDRESQSQRTVESPQ